MKLMFQQSIEFCIVDESFNDIGNIQYQISYKEGKAQEAWIDYYDRGKTWIKAYYNNGKKQVYDDKDY